MTFILIFSIQILQISTIFAFRRVKINENPVQLYPREKPCFKCIHLDVKIQGQNAKLEKLRKTCSEQRDIIRSLRVLLARSKHKAETMKQLIPVNRLIKCSICQKKSFEENHICDGRQEINCDYCGVAFTSTSDLVHHLSILHEQKQFQQCDKCPEVYSMDLLLQFHSKSHAHGEPLVECDECEKKFHTDHQLKMHKDEVHEGVCILVKPFQCGKCGKCFVEADELQKHIRLHGTAEAKGSFECFLCKKKLKSLRATRTHLQKVHERTDKCTICNESFTPTELNEHLCCELKVIKCAYCKRKSFKVIKQLLTHLKDDCRSVKLNYRCDICMRYFPMKMLRDIHMKHGHTDEAPKTHICDLCPKRFATKLGLKLHKNRHTGARGNYSILI